MSANVDDAAVRWAVLIDSAAMNGIQKQELDDWLAQDGRHRGALFRARAGLALLDHRGAEANIAPAPTRRRFLLPTALAASLAGLLFFAWAYPWGETYHTEIGEIRRVALSDGSVAIVNSGSELEVNYHKAVRTLKLDEGEAWFKVAKNRQRPFIVAVEGVHVRATGTAFSVRRRTRSVEIVVTEGAVLAWRDGHPEQALAISAGNAATIDTMSQTAPAKTVALGDRDPLAWRQGGLALHDTSVFEAAEEFNRYNLAKIEIASPHIGAQLMTGYFQIDRPDEFSQAVSDVTGGKMSKKDNKYVIK